MTDFDDYDDLDAVRDFRSPVGLMTRDADERIRRQIFERAAQRGLIDLTAEGDGGEPHAPASSPSRRNSEGTAAPIVELHAAARPPARPGRMLVAAAAAVVMVLLVGSLLIRRTRGPNDDLDITNPGPPVSTSITPSTQAAPTVEDLRTAMEAQPDTPLAGSQTFDTVDAIEMPVIDTNLGRGQLTYELRQQRGRSGPGAGSAGEGTFRPDDGGPTTNREPPTPVTSADVLYSGFSYDEVRSLADIADVSTMRARIAERFATGGADAPFVIVQAELQLIRLPFTPPRARSLLVGALVEQFAVQSQTSAGGVFTFVVADGSAAVEITFKDVPTAPVLDRFVRTDSGHVTDSLTVLQSIVG